jgi:hypothetical protein
MNYNLLLLYAALFLSGFIIANFMTKGFLLTWWRVKRSNGKKIMVRVWNAADFYYKDGQMDNGFVHYTARKRKDNPTPSRMICHVITDDNGKQVDISKKAVYHSLGINWIDVDDIKNCILYLDENSYMACPGFNAELNDEALNTALAKPSDVNALFTEKVFQIIVCIGFIIMIVGFYLVISKIKAHDANLKMVYDMVQPMYNTMFNTTGVPIPVGG